MTHTLSENLRLMQDRDTGVFARREMQCDCINPNLTCVPGPLDDCNFSNSCSISTTYPPLERRKPLLSNCKNRMQLWRVGFAIFDDKLTTADRSTRWHRSLQPACIQNDADWSCGHFLASWLMFYHILVHSWLNRPCLSATDRPLSGMRGKSSDMILPTKDTTLHPMTLSLFNPRYFRPMTSWLHQQHKHIPVKSLHQLSAHFA